MYKPLFTHALIAATLLSSSAVAQEFAITDLGTLAGLSSKAHALNSSGQVVGDSRVGVLAMHGFLWEDGEMFDLGTVGYQLGSVASAINDAGYIVVVSGCNATLWYDGDFIDVQPDEEPLAESWAVDINNVQQVIGYYSPQSELSRAVIWDWVGGEWVMHELETLGGTFSSLISLNDNGAVVGYSQTGEAHPLYEGREIRHAFMWQADVGMVDLGTLGGYESSAEDVNDSGVVVGSAETEDFLEYYGLQPVTHAFLHQNGQMQDLGTLGGHLSGANAINNLGHVVGVSGTSLDDILAFSVFLWRGGVMHDLNQRIPQDSGWSLGWVTDINDAGQIVGSGVNPEGQGHAFLLTPLGCAPDGRGRVTICHQPPGNPNHASTKSVNASAAAAHLEHGDYCGPCN